MKHRFLLLIIFTFFFSLVSNATHIVGGSLTYEQVGGASYRITLKLYRNCAKYHNPPPADTTIWYDPSDFPGYVDIRIKLNNGTYLKTVDIAYTSRSTVDPNIDTCAIKSNICLEEAVYTKIVSGMPPISGGYHMYYQLCCRNASINNILNPLQNGEVFYAHIPDNGKVISNSSPKWVSPPPVFVCQGNDVGFDHSATDADGDSLVYLLYSPFNGSVPNGAYNGKTDSSLISYPLAVFSVPAVKWAPGYGANNPLNASIPNSLTINSSGILHGVPPNIGQYVAGVRCQEWRNGVLIGEILRDFQFNVVPCPPLAVAAFTPTSGCKSKTITFNNAPAAKGYLWDFGDGTAVTAENKKQKPVHTYASLGKYIVRFIVNPYTACADTVLDTLNISFVKSAFTDDAPKCNKLPVNFIDQSTVDPSTTIKSWDWNFGDGTTSTSKNPVHTYNAGGFYNVKLITTSKSGCKDTLVLIDTIQGSPLANAGLDISSCRNKPTVTLGATVLNAGGGVWNATGAFTPDNKTLNATYTPTAAAIAAGFDMLQLVTIDNDFCSGDIDTVKIIFTDAPTANAGSDIFVCIDTAYIPVCGSVNLATGGVWGTTGTGMFVKDDTLCTEYIPSVADRQAGSFIIYLTTTGNGSCNSTKDSTIVTFTSPPVSIITSGDTACSRQAFSISATSTTGSGKWTTMGTGTFSPDSKTLNGSYLPGATDNFTNKVKLIFSTTNNGGCLSYSDTVDVVLLPTPDAIFTSSNFCQLDTIEFTDKSTTAFGTIVSRLWEFGDSVIDSLINPTHYYDTAGSYPVSLIVESSNGCIDTTIQTLNIYENPIARFYTTGACLGDGTIFSDSSFVVGGLINTWKWTFGDSTIVDTVQNPLHIFPSSGSYTTKLTVKTSDGCIDSVSQTVGVIPSPKADFTSSDFTGVYNQTIYFTDSSSTDVIDWLWNFGDSSPDSASTFEDPSHVYKRLGYFDVCLMVKAANDCADTICKTEVITMPPAIPNGFSPNGDGENDILFIYGGPFKKLDFKIYNNWGQLIFQSSNQNAGWDGKFEGVNQPMGVYVYTVTGTTEDDNDYSLSGDVTLLR